MKQQRIIDSSERILEQHRSHAEKNFVETQAYRNATEILRLHRRLIITGKSGQGKSYVAHQLLNKIIGDNSNIKPLILSTVDQWRTLVDCSVTFGIIVDDMCGKVCLTEGELMKWREESAYMPALIEKGKHFVIFTIKSFFYEKILVNMQSRPLFSKQIILNLDNFRLKFAEKTEFANTYLKDFCLSTVEVSDLCKIHEAPVGFPQLCRAAEMIKDKSRLFDLFLKPREMILEQIKHIRRDDSMTYGCLVLVLLSRGKLNLQSIREFGDDSEKKENIVKLVFRSCGIPNVKPIKVLDTVKSLQGTYLSLDPSVESYSFDHDSIEDAVFISHGEVFPEQTLRYCPLQLICKRCTIKYDSKALQTTLQDNTLILQPSCQVHLINRLIAALRGCNPIDFTIVSEANIWSYKDFRRPFFAECKELHFLADKDENSLLVNAANANNRDLVDELLHELDYIPEDKKKNVTDFLTKSATTSCVHKDTYLLEKICKNGRVDVNDILPITIQHGSVDAIKFILGRGADINYRSKNGENLLHTACLHGRLDIVKFLHSENANLVHEFDNDGRSVGLCVAAGGSVEILEFLLPLGLNPLYTDPTGWNLLHYACWQAKKAMVEHLVDKYSKLLCSETKEGFSVLLCSAEMDNRKRAPAHHAAISGNIAVLNYLIDRGTDPWCKAYEEETLLHTACINGQLEMTKYLVQTYPTMLHEVDNMKTTPAHHATQSGNIALLSYLIDCGTDPWRKTSEEETLLHRACINGQLEMTKHLVQTYPTMLHDVDTKHFEIAPMSIKLVADGVTRSATSKKFGFKIDFLYCD